MKYISGCRKIHASVNLSKLNMLWLLMFFNAAGAWSSWLMIGPYLVSSQMLQFAAFGFVALIRQLFGFGGALWAESWRPKTSSAVLNGRLELALCAVNSLALICVWQLPESSTVVWAGGWGLIRFFIGGISTVVGYKLLVELAQENKTMDSKTRASNSLIGQLAVGQGSIILGSLLSILFSFINTRLGLSLALLFDICTSLFFALWLYGINMPGTVLKVTDKAGFQLMDAMKSLFVDLKFRDSSMFILSLLSLSSLPTIFLYLGRGNDSESFSKFYSAMNFVNGTFLLFSAYQMTRNRISLFQDRNFYVGGILISVVGCVLALYLSQNFNWVFIISSLLSLGSTAALLSVHKIVMARSLNENILRLRTSMALYLNLIFGLGEYSCAKLVDYGLMNIWIVIKILMGLLGVGLMVGGETTFRRRKTING